jgi:uncharacterized protein YjiS (DUF1127 family)
MALSLSGERSVVAATPFNPFAAFARWIVRVQAVRARRSALKGLLEFDTERLRDLGISRSDVVSAVAGKGAAGGLGLNMARARNVARQGL